jgi:DNA processing protein
MYLDSEKEATILWSLLSEPGDQLAHLVFANRGPAAISDFKSGRAKKLWPEIIEAEAPEFLFELPAMFERVAMRIDTLSVSQRVERAIRWSAKPVFQDDAPVLWGKFEDLGHSAPYLLWVAGDISALENPSVSIVGTRRPSSFGIKNTQRLVTQIGLPVVSGGASGIDAAAHQAALDIKLPSFAFMAGGVDRAYPLENWPLFHEMVRAGGALIAETAPGTAPSRFRFLLRNRLIAATGDSLFVVEAGYRSGSRNSANHARNLGRDVYAVPARFGKTIPQGTNAMIKEGLAEAWPIQTGIQIEPDWVQKRVFDAIRNGAITDQEIAMESGLSLGLVAKNLPEMRLTR